MAYDKVKAHEYYVNYVKKGLKKGRTKKQTAEEEAAAKRKSTTGLSKEGKAAAKQVKQQLQAEKKQELEKLQADMKQKIADLQARIKAAKVNKNSKLPADDIMNMGSNDTVDSLKAEIEKLRSETKAAKDKIKADYDERYLQMLDEMKGDKDYKETKKSTKKKSKK